MKEKTLITVINGSFYYSWCALEVCVILASSKQILKDTPLWANELQKVPPARPLRQSEAAGLTPRQHLAVNPHVGTAASRLQGPGRWTPSVSKPIWPNALHSSQMIPPYTRPWLQAHAWCLINICEWMNECFTM